MSSDRSPGIEVEELCAALCDGQITPEETLRLESLVESDEDARRTYIEYLNLHAALQWYNTPQASVDVESSAGAVHPEPASSPDDDDAASSPDTHSNPGRPPILVLRDSLAQMTTHPMAFSLGTAAVVTFVLLGLLNVIPLGPPDSPPIVPPKYVASITRTVGCEWGDMPTSVNEGSRLQVGQGLVLNSGTADIDFDDGATTEIRGPCEFRVAGSNAGELTAGRLTAHVPPAAAGFAVNTPAVRVVDLGTEFGVLVENDGDTAEVHVFDGEVEAEQWGVMGPTGKMLSLLKNHAARFERSEIYEFQATTDFMGAYENYHKESLKNDHQDWMTKIREHAGHPDLVAMYIPNDPDQQQEIEQTLSNLAQATQPHLDGTWLGRGGLGDTKPYWTTGRRGQPRSALLFDSQHYSHVHVEPHEALHTAESLSIVTSVRRRQRQQAVGTIVFVRDMAKFHMNYAVAMRSEEKDGQEQGERILFATRTNDVEKPALYYSDFLPTNRGWQHIAVTYDGQSVQFYHNGQPAGRHAVEHPLVIESANLLIGRDDPMDPSGEYPEEDFRIPGELPQGLHAALDELRIYKVVLSPQEVGELYQEGGFDPPPEPAARGQGPT